MSLTWELRDYDQEFFRRELESFVPPEIFDSHAHLYKVHHFGGRLKHGPAEVGLQVFRHQNVARPAVVGEGHSPALPEAGPDGFAAADPGDCPPELVGREALDALGVGQFHLLATTPAPASARNWPCTTPSVS